MVRTAVAVVLVLVEALVVEALVVEALVVEALVVEALVVGVSVTVAHRRVVDHQVSVIPAQKAAARMRFSYG